MFPLRDEVPTRSFPLITVLFIAVNVLVYIYQLTLDEPAVQALVYKWAYIPIEYTHFTQVYPQLAVPYGVTVITSMFMHGGFMHLAGNMLYLWIFGNNVEDNLGKLHFIVFYLLSGIAAVGLHTVLDPNSEVPLIGASGAIAGVLGAYMVLYPKARVHTVIFLGFFVQVVRIPAGVLLIIWFGLQILYGLPGLLSEGGGGVAWFAHVGGFAFGWLYFKLLRRRPAYEPLGY
ncbi:MAG: rhomboid family intramembrane serine protease [candidate division Zixibacteria bacterium]|nr:rhomboid family intramembrane serine protease [candidate division Zixibacteria bacterium]